VTATLCAAGRDTRRANSYYDYATFRAATFPFRAAAFPFRAAAFPFRAATFPGRRERSSCLFLVAWEGHQADKRAR